MSNFSLSSSLARLRIGIDIDPTSNDIDQARSRAVPAAHSEREASYNSPASSEQSALPQRDDARAERSIALASEPVSPRNDPGNTAQGYQSIEPVIRLFSALTSAVAAISIWQGVHVAR